MAQARNDAQLKAMLLPKIKIAVDYLVQKIWKENQEIVKQVVYEAYSPKEYERSGQFKQAWETDVKTAGSVVEGQFKYDPRLLDVVPEKGQHSSIAYNTEGDPMTTYLAEIIYQGLAGDFTGEYKYASQNPRFAGEAWTKKRDAWKQLQDRLDRTLLKKWMMEGFNKAGLSVQSHNKTWGKIEW